MQASHCSSSICVCYFVFSYNLRRLLISELQCGSYFQQLDMLSIPDNGGVSSADEESLAPSPLLSVKKETV